MKTWHNYFDSYLLMEKKVLEDKGDSSPEGARKYALCVYKLEHRQRFERFLLSAGGDIETAMRWLELYYRAISLHGAASVHFHTLVGKDD